MDRDKAYVLWFDELRREDVEIVGGKSSSLGEMTSKTDVPVPYGFATTAYAYRQFMERTGLDKKIREELKKLTDVEDSALLREVTDNIRAMIVAEDMPEDIVEAIKDAYAELGEKMHVDDPFVAVRSSATAEDLPDASFAGQQDTYLNVYGRAEDQGVLRLHLHRPRHLLSREDGFRPSVHRAFRNRPDDGLLQGSRRHVLA